MAARGSPSATPVGLLYNNLAEDLGRAQGPRAQLELARQGAAFTQRREIAEWDAATRPAQRALPAGPVEWVEQAVKRHGEFGEPQWLTTLLVPAAAARAGAGDARGAVTLLTVLEPVRNVRHTPEHMRSLPDIVRVTIAAGEPGLAARFAVGLTPVHPLDQHALVTARAQLAEHCEAAALYADAKRRWKQFEMPWERAHALLGHGRCLPALGHPAEAREPLHAAREIFASPGATPRPHRNR